MKEERGTYEKKTDQAIGNGNPARNERDCSSFLRFLDCSERGDS